MEAVVRFILSFMILTAVSPATASQLESSVTNCPVGGEKVAVYRLYTQNALGGWDSDGARYSTGGQGRSYEVSTCNNGLSLYARDMAVGLPDPSKEKLGPILLAIQSENPGQQLGSFPAWKKHVFAARCYAAMERGALTEARLYLSASWLVRDKAVGVYKGLDGPVMARLIMEGGDGELAKNLTLDQRKQVLFNLVKVAHRGGYSAERDKYLESIDALPELVPAEKELLEVMRWASRTEPGLQDKALAAMERALKGQLEKDERWSITYQAADLYRRRGKVERARTLFASLDKASVSNVAVKELSAYFLAEMSGGSPWLDRRFQLLGSM
ncbi:MAG: hypothetical protein ACI9MC_000996 [Kiritimatiellia bacterium]|jgi:hypothetical protein